MNWWDLVREAGDTFLAQHGLLAAFAYLAVEESGVPIPVPGDFLMLALGVRAREGSIVMWQVIAALEAGTLLGASLLYLLARRGGRSLVERLGRFIGVGPEQLDRAEKQLQRHGAMAVVLGRLLPGLRILTTIACGMFRVPYRVFLPAMAVGSLIYIVGYTMLGYFAGPAVLGLFEALHLPVGLIGSGGPLLLLVVGLILVRRGLPHPLPRPVLHTWPRARLGVLAGLLASGGALLALDLVVVVAGDLAWRLPDSWLADAAGQLAQALAHDATGGLLWLLVPLLAGVGWGAVYAVWAEPRLTGSRWSARAAVCACAVPGRRWIAGTVARASGGYHACSTRCPVHRGGSAGLLWPHPGTRLPRVAGTPAAGSRRTRHSGRFVHAVTGAHRPHEPIGIAPRMWR